MDPSEWAEYRRLAFAVARRQGAGEWADVVADETIKRFWRDRESVDNPRAWIPVVARRLAIDWNRREPAGGWTDLPDGREEDGGRAHPAQLRVDSPSSDAARRALLRQVLGVLNEIERKLLIGKEEGYSSRELAEMYRYTEGSVRVKLTVARRKIREAFPDLAAEFGGTD